MVNKSAHFLIAGLVWIIAGLMVIVPGVRALEAIHSLVIITGVIAVFLIFYGFIFSKLLSHHEERLKKEARSRLPLWMFFDKKSYLIMFFMMSGGMILRLSGLLPIGFFAFFYTGLGLALIGAGIRFLAIYERSRHAETDFS